MNVTAIEWLLGYKIGKAYIRLDSWHFSVGVDRSGYFAEVSVWVHCGRHLWVFLLDSPLEPEKRRRAYEDEDLRVREFPEGR